MNKRQQKTKELLNVLDEYYRYHEVQYQFTCLEPITPKNSMFPIVEQVKAFEKVLLNGKLPEEARMMWAEILCQSNNPSGTIPRFFELFMKFWHWVEKNGPTLKPKWDSKKRELWFDDQNIKKYKRSAPNQEAIWETFEKEGWPQDIKNPFSPSQLADTIKDIQKSLLHAPFVIERNGKNGIRWRLR